MALQTPYIIAKGPEGLRKVLDDTLAQIQSDPKIPKSHYILYEMGEQKSLIRVDMNKKPFKFWFNDLMGRPASPIVKDTIALFLWEKGGERERYEQDA